MHIFTSENTLLRQASQEVLFPLSKDQQKLSQELLNYVNEDEGSAGLAAPQTGNFLRMVVVTNAKRIPKLLINPRITLQSHDTKEFPEGCLSIPGKLYLVSRSNTIKYTYQDHKGKHHQAKATGWEARVIQHEIDHLNGILIDKSGIPISKEEAKKYYE